MSFLAPFYLLGGLAVALPIAFHLIRRTPHGRQFFSSLLFLSPSPPRVTRRSRIEDWYLLLLRALAVCLLAFAFARPFLRAQSQRVQPVPHSEQMLVLLDRSASMQREGYWQQALTEVERVLRAAGPLDAVEVQCFDDSAVNVLSFQEWSALPVASRANAVMDRVRKLRPGWHGTAAGKVLLAAAEDFQRADDADLQTRRVVLISDLQVGGGWDVLNGSLWPETIRVQVLSIGSSDEVNGWAEVVEDDRAESQPLRVRISTTPRAGPEPLTLGWLDRFSTEESPATTGRTIRVSVADGQSVIVQVPQLGSKQSSSALLLTGDEVDFDNVRYLIRPQQRVVQIVYLGEPEGSNRPEQLRFFLDPLFPDTAERQVEIIDWNETASPAGLREKGPDWVIVAQTPSSSQLEWLTHYLQRGGEVLFVARTPQQSKAVYDLLSLPPADVEEATVENYAMLGRIDFQHSALQQFDDPRFSDFTKLRFWKHRRFTLETLSGARVLAAFEDGSPAIAEIPIGPGQVVLFAAGWNRDDSDLAVWSKFVPLMNSLLELAAPVSGPRAQFNVGDAMALQDLGLEAPSVVVGFQGEKTTRPVEEMWHFEQPGLYRFAASSEQLQAGDVVEVAVNVPAAESRTQRQPVESLAAAGLPLENPRKPAQANPLLERQLMNQELESQQQWWRLLIVVALSVLFLESAFAAWKSRSPRVIGA